MKLLAIDTSTEKASVALKTDGQIIQESWTDQRKQAQHILPAIESLLLKASLSVTDLDGIVFGCGPGSFTGLRIACSVAKGLAYAARLPVYPVSTLSAIAWQVRAQEKYTHSAVLCMLDARMQEWYWAYFESDSRIAEEQVGSAQSIHIPLLTACVLAGVGFEQDSEILPQSIQDNIVEKITVYPEASALIQLVEAGGISAVSAMQAAPLYIRNSVVQGEKNQGL